MQVHGSYVICRHCGENTEVELCGGQVIMQCFNCDFIEDVKEKDIIKIYKTPLKEITRSPEVNSK